MSNVDFSKYDGIYAGYMTGAEGNGLGWFVFSDGHIVGTDLEGVTFDGRFNEIIDHKIIGSCTVEIPPQVQVIQGVKAGPESLRYDTSISLPVDFNEATVTRIDTQLGPVNLKLQKLRDLGALGSNDV